MMYETMYHRTEITLNGEKLIVVCHGDYIPPCKGRMVNGLQEEQDDGDYVVIYEVLDKNGRDLISELDDDQVEELEQEMQESMVGYVQCR